MLVKRIFRGVAATGLPGLAVLSFGLGAGMELFMCNVKVNGIGFYDVAKRKRAEAIVDAEEQREQMKQALGEVNSSAGQAPDSNQRPPQQ